MHSEIFNHEPSYMLCRPGKEEGVSARLFSGKDDGTPLLVNFSTNALNGDGTYSPFELVKWVMFDGDPAKAFKFIRDEWECDNPLNGIENTEETVKRLEELIECKATPEIITELGEFRIGVDGVARVLRNYDIEFKETELANVPDQAFNNSGDKRNPIKTLLGLFENCEFLINQYDEPFVGLLQGKAIPTDSAGDWLRTKARKELDMFPTKQQIKEALTHLGSTVLDDGKPAIIGNRSHIIGDEIFIDIGDKAGSVVVVTKRGWKITGKPTKVIFQEGGNNYGQLPFPAKGGKVDDLWQLIHADSIQKQLFVLAIILQAFFGGGFLGFLHGSAGSSKTTAARIIKALVDPDAKLEDMGDSGEARPEDRQLMLDEAFMLMLDNLTEANFENMRSDICLASTGGKIRKRKLYSNGELTDVRIRCNVLCTGITFSSKHEDVIDRLLPVEFQQIKSEHKKDISEVWADFDVCKGSVMGAICDMLSAGLNTQGGETCSRFPLLEQRLTTALKPIGNFTEELRASFEATAGEHMESAPWTATLLKVLEEDGRREFTAKSLDDLMRKRLKSDMAEVYKTERILRMPKLWPQGSRYVGTRIRQEIPNLRKLGWEVEFKRKSSGRYWLFTQVDK